MTKKPLNSQPQVGRPKKGDQKRTILKSIYYSEEEYTLLQNNQKKTNLKENDYIRNASLKVKMSPKINDEELNILRQIIGIANNVNQIAHNINQGKSDSKSESVINYLHEVIRKIRNQ